MQQSVSNEARPGATPQIVEILPTSGWFNIDWRELWRYRDLLYFMVWRDIKVRYAQSVLGIGWAVIQPVFSMIVFTIVFGNLAKIESDGIPYAIFNFAALVPWTYFANSLTGATDSLVASGRMLSKVYFPRIVIPLAPVFGRLIDFVIALFLLAGLMLWYGIRPVTAAWFLPVLILLMMFNAAGLGMWLTSLAIQYRDVKYGMNFGIQLLMYAAPVVYPTSNVPDRFRLLYAVNPMVGVIEGFRASLLSTTAMPWDLITISALSSLVILLTGLFYFQRMEQFFADVA